jgi:leucyl/phenylalanyl-tRNA--protein transferase
MSTRPARHRLRWVDARDPLPSADTALSEPNGLVCAGLDLSPERVLEAYHKGLFPWFNEGQPVLWWSPDPRLVLRPEQFRLHRSLRQVLRRGGYRIRVDHAFDEVMLACAEPRPDQDGTWITEEIRAVYGALHRQGIAHSVETWVDEELVGGLYGLAIGRVFFGESMFARVSDASKIALAHLVAQLKRWGYVLIDCQQETRHLAFLGAAPIPRRQFLDELAAAVREPGYPGRWRFDADLDRYWTAPGGVSR